MTIAWHLEQEGYVAPSTSTIRRILRAAGHVSVSRTRTGDVIAEFRIDPTKNYQRKTA